MWCATTVLLFESDDTFQNKRYVKSDILNYTPEFQNQFLLSANQASEVFIFSIFFKSGVKVQFADFRGFLVWNVTEDLMKVLWLDTWSSLVCTTPGCRIMQTEFFTDFFFFKPGVISLTPGLSEIKTT